MAQAQDTNYRVGLARNGIVDFGATEPAINGGGKGWTASTTLGGMPITAKGAGKALAIEALLEAVRLAIYESQADPDDHGEALAAEQAKERPSVEDALAVLGLIFGEFDVDEEDDDRKPGPVWKGVTLVKVVPCVGECMMASPSSPCDCRCDGSNHAIGGAFMFPILTAAVASADPAQFKAALKQARPVRLEPKPCLCGCGGETMRRFVPGHDARYHAAIKAGFKSVAEHVKAKDAAALEKQTAKTQADQLRAQAKEAKATAKTPAPEQQGADLPF